MQVASGDSVYLYEGSLHATLATDFALQNETFDIISTSAGTYETFAGLAEGGAFTVGGTPFSITYKGGAKAADVVLAATAAPAAHGAIVGAVCDDFNDNGRLDPGEPGLQGWTVYLDDNGNSALDPSEARAITDANGNFSFTNLAAGTYTLREVLPTGWTQTLPGGATMSYSIPLGTGAGADDENFLNVAVSVVAPASATLDPATGMTAALTTLGANVAESEANLTYTWTATGPAVPIFSDNADNTAKKTTAAFSSAGAYEFTVTIADTAGRTATSVVDVTVNQTLTSVVVSPSSADLSANATQQFTATANDQFGHPLLTQPASFAWSTTVGGIDAAGCFAAQAASGSGDVEAAVGPISGSCPVTVVDHRPTVVNKASVAFNSTPETTAALAVLGANVDENETNLTYAWSATGPAAPSFSDNADNAAKNVTAAFSSAGAYEFTATITDTGGMTATSVVDATVDQTLTSIVVSPSSVSLSANATQQFTATAYDQFGHPLLTQPAFTWSATAGTGTIDGAGLFTPGSGSGDVEAAVGSVNGSSTVMVVPAVTSLSPAVGPLAGGTTVLITGAGFSGRHSRGFLERRRRAVLRSTRRRRLRPQARRAQAR